MNRRPVAVLVAIVLLVGAVAGVLVVRRTAKSTGTRVAGAVAADAGASVKPRRRMPGDTSVKDPDPIGPLRLEGQVIDPAQHGVGGAAVAIDTYPIREVITEDDGSFVVEGLLPRTYTVIARKDRLASMSVTVRLRDTTEPVILRMRPGITVAIHVVDAEDGAPIVGAMVTSSWLLYEETETGADGVAIVLGFDRWLSAEIEAAGYALGSFGMELPDDPGGRLDRTVRLTRGAPLSGVVLGPDDRPQPDTEVWAEGAVNQWATAETDANGKFRFDALAAGTYTVTAFSDGFVSGTSDPIDVDGVTARDGVVVRLVEGVAIRGEVVDAQGAAVALAEVTAWVGFAQRKTSTDATGKFEVRGMPRGELEVVAVADDRASRTTTVDASAGDVGGIRLVLADGIIAGVVVDPHGEPVAEAPVSAMPMGVGMITSDSDDLTDSAGRFQLGPLSPGEYMVWASPPGADPTALTEWDRRVTASTGTRDLRLVLPATAELTGVVTLDGAPVTEYAIAVGRFASGAVVTIVRAADGRFVVRGLTPGEQAVVIVADGAERHEQGGFTVAAGARTDVGTIALHRGRVLRGRVVDPRGAGVAYAAVALSPRLTPTSVGLGDDEDPLNAAMRGEYAAMTASDGTFAITGLSTESLQAMADHPRIGRSAVASIAPDQTEVTLALIATGEIRGVVTGVDGDLTSVQASLVAGGPSINAWLDASNHYRISRLVPGQYQVSAGTGDASLQRRTPTKIVEVTAGKTTTVELAFVTGSIALVVHVGARKCFDVSLQLAGAAIERDELVRTFCDGPDVELPALAPGDYQLCLGRDDCRPITITASPARQTVDLSGA